MVAYPISKVCFITDVPAPDGKFVRTLSSNEYTKLERDGDSLVVTAKVPKFGDGGQFETVVVDYNWAVTCWSVREPETPKTQPTAKPR